jgi:aminomethyltransferase
MPEPTPELMPELMPESVLAPVPEPDSPENPPGFLHTPLQKIHKAEGARMVPFAGWELPVYYTGITREVQAVRERAGLFDISHMGRLQLAGKGADVALQRLTVNDIRALSEPGAGQYTLMLRPDGGTLDDMIVYRREGSHFLLIVNASNRIKILGWLKEHLPSSVSVVDHTLETTLLALQGPMSIPLLKDLGCDKPPARFNIASARLGGVHCLVSRTGYTGEEGVEIITAAADAPALWELLRSRGVEPCGLGARDTLRLEAAYCLYGHELTEEINPIEAGLSWVVKPDKGDFSGRDAVTHVFPSRKLTGILMNERSVPRPGQMVTVGSESVGVITSGTFSPTLTRSIALAYVRTDVAVPGTQVVVDPGTRGRGGVIQKLPFYRARSTKR